MPGTARDKNGLVYNVHTGHKVNKKLYTPRDDAGSKPKNSAKSTTKSKDNEAGTDKDIPERKFGGPVVEMARRYADGGAVMRAYEPSWIDRMAATVAGDERDTVRQRVAERLFGTRGMGRTGSVSLGEITPFNHTVSAVEDASKGNGKGALINSAKALADFYGAKGIGGFASSAPSKMAGSMERARDAEMAAKLAKEGSGPAAFPPGITGDSVMRAGHMFGDVRTGSDMVVRHPGFEPAMMNRAGGVNQINSNNPLPPERLRMLYPNFADGGVPEIGAMPPPGPMDESEGPMIPHGPVHGPDGGRADTRPVSVPDGSFVVPADVVAALGEGNTQAGFTQLDDMFGTAETMHMASGGVPERAVPIMISDGEYVISPSKVAEIGNGNLDVGHKALDKFIVQLRQQNIKKLQSLPGPAKN